MLNENPFQSSWDSDRIGQALTQYLQRSDVLLIALVVCAAIALGALLKVSADLRSARTKRSSTASHTASHRASNQFPGPWERVEPELTGNVLIQRDLDNSQRNRALKCDWKRDAIQPHVGMTRWRCSACKGFAFTSDGHRPTTCRVHDPSQKI